jgi:catechol 2,3-dioxygenase-like lactoylglutathione lyase family enzyme
MKRSAVGNVFLTTAAAVIWMAAEAPAQAQSAATIANAPRAQSEDKHFVKPIQLGFTKLVVEDIDGMSKFYRALCGFEEEERGDAKIGGHPIREVHFRSDPPGTGTFTLTKFLDARRPITQAIILGFIAPNMNQFVERALKAGATLVEPVTSQPEHGVKFAFVKDIEGNLIELVELL